MLGIPLSSSMAQNGVISYSTRNDVLLITQVLAVLARRFQDCRNVHAGVGYAPSFLHMYQLLLCHVLEKCSAMHHIDHSYI